MGKRKKKRDSLSATDKTRHLVNTTISKRYKVYAIMGALTLIMTFMIGIVYRPITQASGEYVLNQIVSFDDLKLSIDKKYISSNERTLAVRLKIERDYSNNPKDLPLEFSAKIKGGKSNNIDFRVYKGTSDYYEIVAKDLPEKWSALKLSVNTSNSKNNGNELSFIFNRKTSSGEFTVLSDDVKFDDSHAAVRSVLQDIEQTEYNRDELIPKQIEELKEAINNKKSEIEKLNDSIKYQIGDEKNKTEASIKTLESSIKNEEKKITTLIDEQHKLEEKVTLLNQKLEEFANKYNIEKSEIHW